MGLKNTLNFLNTHPLCRIHKLRAFGNFFRWQFLSRLSSNQQVAFIFPFVEHIKIVARKSETGVSGNIYAGLHEFVDMALVLHFLSEGDLFFDIGANVGSYTLLGSVCGARVVAVEPVTRTYAKLLENIGVNNLYETVFPLKKAVGAESSIGRITLELGSENRVVSNTTSEKSDVLNSPTEEVEIITIDQITEQYGCPTAIKVDIEGYEDYAFSGATETLSNPLLHLLLVETVSPDLELKLQHFGFSRIYYNPFTRDLDNTLISQSLQSGNQLYIRNLDTILQRISSSPTYFICNFNISI